MSQAAHGTEGVIRTAAARTKAGFTLLELSIVLALIGIILGMGLVTMTGSLQASQYNATVSRMDEIEKALLNFAIANNRIPCPADLSLTSNSANYGFEAGAGAGGVASGECVTGMTPAASFKAASGAVEGGVPTRALQLPDEYMYDGWGKKFRYAVDPTMTKAAALPAAAHRVCSASSSSAITVNDSAGTARTTAGIYALISHGANGHGAYTGNGVTVNSGSVSADELTNCHCTSTGAYTGTYTATYVEKVPMQNPANALDSFDDIVTFKEGWQMQAMNYPLSPAAQCIYVSDYGNNRVQIFDSKGAYRSQFGTAGTGNGQFNGPWGIAVDASGNVWVVDYGNSRVEKFDANGNYVSQFGTSGTGNGQLYFPWGIALDASGNIWVADSNNNRVEKFDSSGNYLLMIGCASGACATGTGNGQFNFPTDIVVNASGNILVTDNKNNRVEKFDANGNYLSQFGTTGTGNGQFTGVDGITVDASGNIWLGDIDHARLQKFDSNGGYLSQFGTAGTGNGQFSQWYHYVAIDASGSLWVTDYDPNNRVQNFDGNGNYLSQFGTAGSGPGQFNYPAHIAIK